MPLILGSNAPTGGYEVDNSLRFDAGSSDYLDKSSYGTPTSTKIFTFSCWVKKAKTGSYRIFDFYSGSPFSYSNALFFTVGDELGIGSGDSNNGRIITTRKFRDQSAWYHVVAVFDSPNATAGDRLQLYVNGVRETDFSANVTVTQNQDYQAFRSDDGGIGTYYDKSTSSEFFGGYMSEVCFIDGQALDPTSFGEFDEDSGIWKPIDVSGLTFGTNGFYLDFENSGSLGADVSGNGNDFTVNNLTSIDQTTDIPTNNFATMNSIDNSSVTLSNGNLTCSCPSPSGTRSTLAVSAGKYYVEVKYTETASFCGVVAMEQLVTSISTSSATLFGGSSGQPELFLNGSAQADYSSAGTLSNGDIIQIALDKDNNNVYFGKNGSWFGGTNWTESSPTTAHALSSGSSYVHGFRASTGSGTRVNSWNFGNAPYTISSGNSDANGYGNFEYAVPSGYYALNTKNLAEYG